jgi:glycosyltransferase involved in cell wall biosynthesis
MTPLRNEAGNILRLFTCTKSLTLRPRRRVVVDDRSTDGSVDKVQRTDIETVMKMVLRFCHETTYISEIPDKVSSAFAADIREPKYVVTLVNDRSLCKTPVLEKTR